MRYVKSALVGLIGGVALTAAVLAVEMVHAERVTAAQMAKCMAESATVGGGVCDGYAQFGGLKMLMMAFALGFITGNVWFLQRRRFAR